MVVPSSSLKSSIGNVPSIRIVVSLIALDRLVRQVELVLDLADDLLQEILEGDDPLRRAVLVDDDRHVLVRAPELGEERGQVLRLGHDVGRAQQRGELDLGDRAVVERRDEVADVEDADDLVERLAEDGVAGVGRLEHGTESLLRCHLDRDADHLGTGHHHVRRLLVGEVEHLVEHLALVLLDLASLGRHLEQHLQLGLRVGLAVGVVGIDADQPLRTFARALQHPDQRCGDEEERPHGNGDAERDPLRVAEREALGHELTDDDVHERDDRKASTTATKVPR